MATSVPTSEHSEPDVTPSKVNPEGTAQGEDPLAEPFDVPGLVGLLIGAFAAVNLLMSFLFPVFPWLIAGACGIVMIPLGLAARPPLHRMLIIGGCIAMIPSIIFALVQLGRLGS